MVDSPEGPVRTSGASTERDEHEGPTTVESDSGAGSRNDDPARWVPSSDLFKEYRGLGLAILLLVVTRVYIYRSVFRKGDVVLLANDPYFYRMKTEMIVTAASGPTDIAALTSQSKTAPLLIAIVAWVSEIAGGHPAIVGSVIAWYPVVAAISTGVLVYVVTIKLTDIRLAGMAATVTLAITPIHAVRTALGFGDHHAFDYVWLILAVLALVVLAESIDFRSRSAWIGAAGLAAAIAGQILAWVGGVILLVPIAIYGQYSALAAVHTGESPVLANVPLLAGIGGGGLLVAVAHAAFGWHPVYLVFVPVALFLGVLGVSLAGELARLTLYPTLGLVGVEGVSIPLAWGVLISLRPTRLLLQRGGEYFTRVTGGDVVEGVSMLGGQLGIITGPFSLFGLLLFVSLPYFIVGLIQAYRETQPAWIAYLIYAWYFLGAAIVQRRFAGELSVVFAPLVGVALIDIASRLAIIQPVNPFARDGRPLSLNLDVPISRVYLLAVIGVLVVSVSFIQIPIRMNQATYDAAEHDAARWMDAYADENDWEYPQNYVVSWWSKNRMYNYFVNYHSVPHLRYSFARSNYFVFLNSASPRETYQRYRGRIGFIVTTDSIRPTVQVLNGSRSQSLSLYSRLHERLTSRKHGIPGLAHYRALWVSQDGSVKVFTLVRGATITGTAAPNTTINVSTDVELEHTRFTYTRVAVSNDSGSFAVTVPYPGEYDVGGSTVIVSDNDVREGRNVTAASPR